MGRWLVAILLVIFGASVGYAAAQTLVGDDETEAEPAVKNTPSGVPEWLYVFVGDSGSLTENSSREVTLTFDDVRDRVVRFSDRPARFAGDMELEPFLELWDEGEAFADDPPNAELEFVTSDGDQHLLTVELQSVSQGGGVTFAARVIGPETTSGSSDFSSATLFIDDAQSDYCSRYASVGGRTLFLCNAGYENGYQDALNQAGADAFDECSGDGGELVACMNGYAQGYGDGVQARG
jgi:hypothetical protein